MEGSSSKWSLIHFLSVCSDTFGEELSLGLLSLSEFGVLLSSGFLLSSQLLNSDLLSLALVDGFDQDSLVLELVTLGLNVEFVVLMLIDLLLGSIFSQKSSKDSLSSHPEDLSGHSGFLGTSSLTLTTMSAFSSGFVVGSCSGSRVDSDVSLDDDTILDELSNTHSGVGEGNLARLVGVEPQSLLSATEDGSSQSLLESKVDHLENY